MDLTSEEVYGVFCDCRFRRNEDEEIFMLGEGIYNRYAFHPDRLLSHREDIQAMLAQLPLPFRQSHGGHSYDGMEVHAGGLHWWLKGQPGTPEKLLMLGLALQLVDYLTPRNMWFLSPGKVPYIVVSDDVASATTQSA